MSVGEGWCGWFYTPVCDYRVYALTVYLHPEAFLTHGELA